MTTRTSGKSRWTPYLFLAPFLLILSLFTAYPVFQSAVMSFQQTFGPKTTRSVGFSNFIWLAHDQLFWKATINTVLFALGSLVTQIPTALGLAMVLNSRQVRGRVFFRLVFFSPSLVGLVFVALLFGPIFEKNTGLLNTSLHRWFGFSLEFPWLERYVMLGLLVAAFWMYVGINMVYFLAALQNVDKSLIEAATVDGAGRWQRFRHIILPSIRPVAAFVVLLSLVGSFQLFELPYVLLNYGAGPENRGLTLVMYLYQRGFELGDLGYASAVGWCLTLVLAMVAVGQHRLLKRKDL